MMRVSFVVYLLALSACQDAMPSASPVPSANAPRVGPADRSRDPNPNGSSELAWLMRDLVAQGKLWGAAVLEGKELGAYPGWLDLLTTAAPTSADMKNDTFDPLASAFKQRTRALLAAPKGERHGAFNRWVDGCFSCHESMCSGATSAIEGLRLSPR